MGKTEIEFERIGILARMSETSVPWEKNLFEMKCNPGWKEKQ